MEIRMEASSASEAGRETRRRAQKEAASASASTSEAATSEAETSEAATSEADGAGKRRTAVNTARTDSAVAEARIEGMDLAPA